jgi:uncharacterized protein YcfJ
VVGSYGAGRATIAAGGGTAIDAVNLGGLTVRGVDVAGNGSARNEGSGIHVANRLPGNQRLAHIRIDRVDARGFGRAGIWVGGDARDGSQSGFRHVRITNCSAHDNEYFGIEVTSVYDPDVTTYAHRDVVVRRCRAYNNPGDPRFRRDNSGSGIFVGHVNHALIEHSVAHGNGRLCAAVTGGPVGIWTAHANDVTIQHNESYDNHTGRPGRDGSGFDLDGGVSNSVLQYNLSHHNDGAGFMVYEYHNSPHEMHDNVVRFNVSLDDVRRGSYGAMFVGNDGEFNRNVDVYNNTVIVDRPIGGSPPALLVYGVDNARFFNNLLVTDGGLPLVVVADERPGLVFAGNNFWSGDHPFLVRHGDAEYRSLAAWRAATSAESVNGGATGMSVAPRLVGPESERTSRRGFAPLADSPLIGAGLDLQVLFGVRLGPIDAVGGTISTLGPYPVGAVGAPAP